MLPSGTFSSRYQEDIAIVRTKTQWALVAVAILFIFALPVWVSEDWVSWIILLSATIIAVLGLHIMTGLCGQFSMGQAAFMAMGAYTAGILGTRYGFPAWATLPLAGIVAALGGLVFATPALRIKGFYLVMATIAAQFIVVWALGEWSPANPLGAGKGIQVPNIEIGGNRVGSVGLAWIALGLTLVMLILAKNIQRTTMGRKFIAVRDNDLAAQVTGVNLFRTKLVAFGIGAFYAGIAGWLAAYAYYRHLMPDEFNFNQSIWFLGMLVVGGLGSTTGAVLGSVGIKLVEKSADYLAPVLSDAFPSLSVVIGSALVGLLFGLVVIIFLLFEPRGIYHWVERFKAYYRLHPYSY